MPLLHRPTNQDVRLPAMRIAGQWRFDPVELASWVKARRMG
jgi:hypothetical protein